MMDEKTATGDVEDVDVDVDAEIEEHEEEDCSSILRECAGGCGNKILFFEFVSSSNWGGGMEGLLCIECKSRPLKHTPVTYGYDNG